MTTPENKMKYVNLGTSGLKVSKIILGAGSFGKTPSVADLWKLDEEASVQVIKAAYDMGINTFNTADMYGNGESERVLGKAIKRYGLPRDEIVVITKAWGIVARPGDNNMYWKSPDEVVAQNRYVNQQGLSRKHLFDAVKHSLERLQLDYVDVLQCHRFDYDTPIEETMRALHDIVEAGYARYIGMSSCYAWQFAKMQYYAKMNGLTEFTHIENFFNPIYREEEREMMPMLKDLGVGMICWSPLAGGTLARPLDASTARKEVDYVAKFMTGVPFLNDLVSKIEEISKARDITMAQVTLAWILSKDGVTAPIVGTTNIKALQESADAIHVKLTPEDIAAIDAVYQPRAVFGPV